MERGLVTGLALNGAGIVHDFELAVAGQTSEDVAEGLGAGAVRHGARDGRGDQPRHRRGRPRRPRAWARRWAATSSGRRRRTSGVSLLAAAWRLGLPATVHVAVGTDIVHMHPACDPAALGRATHLDFRIFAGEVARLGGGGVYLNVGSAVLLPEVFLKAVTAGAQPRPRPRGLRHRQPRLHPVLPARTRTWCSGPTRGVGRGYSLTGHHEILVPLLAAALVEGAG